MPHDLPAVVNTLPHDFEDQTLLLHEALDQLIPDQPALDQLAPDQEALDQEALDQLAPDQLALDQLAPDQLDPFQVPPDQPALWAAAVDQEALSNATPKMSCSPSRATCPSIRCAEPRAASRKPVPLGAACACFAAGVSVLRALARFNAPAPWQVLDEYLSSRAESISRALTWSGFMPGRWSIMSAAAPDTMAADWDVPLPLKNRVPTRADGYATSAEEPGTRRLSSDFPGATRSTLRSQLPQLENDVTMSSQTRSVPLVSLAPTAIT